MSNEMPPDRIWVVWVPKIGHFVDVIMTESPTETAGVFRMSTEYVRADTLDRAANDHRRLLESIGNEAGDG
jgi:hypothetical protein